MSIAEQIALAIAQQTQEGGWNLSEAITYQYQNKAPETGIRATIRRGDGESTTLLGNDYETYTAIIMIAEGDLSYAPRRGDKVTTATETWHIEGPRAQIPGAYLLDAVRRKLVDAVQE